MRKRRDCGGKGRVEMTARHGHCVRTRRGRLPSLTLSQSLTDEGRERSVICSDGLGVELGPMLGNCVGHWGMRKKNEQEVELFVDSANVDILCTTKHWLRNGQLLFGFHNHKVARSFNRENSSNGGFSIVIRNNIKLKFGFTRGRLTIDAGVELVEKIFDAWEDSQNEIGVFCDLSKAFVCVNHKTVIRKLHYYGVTGCALDLLASYLANRYEVIWHPASGICCGCSQNFRFSKPGHSRNLRLGPRVSLRISREANEQASYQRVDGHHHHEHSQPQRSHLGIARLLGGNSVFNGRGRGGLGHRNSYSLNGKQHKKLLHQVRFL
ncbi:hypothetical protein EVAR_95710_1 [Eumeta japonica]|uniref:Uncharacterized protein n=1 Tax=Eumeta variegata TaxID=151549 RepID=A0A4C1UM34_EUMVA|nr:hypothetical protein EVAR_95710_1 [Eumeta japonica]